MSDKTTPQNVAVALQYDAGQDAAPRVTAKGQGAVADRIVEVARQNGVVIEGNPLLAQALVQVDLDSEIPEELYRAVAEVIGFILRRSGTLK